MEKYRKKKRVTFKKLLICGFVWVMVITVLLANAAHYLYYHNIRESCTQMKLDTVQSLQCEILVWERELEQLSIQFDQENNVYDILNSVSEWVFPRFYFPIVLADTNGDVIASNAIGMKVRIQGYPGYDDKVFYCRKNTDIPEVDAMLKDCSDLVSMYYRNEKDHYINFELDSIYADDDKGEFVPHTGKMQLCKQINKKDRSGIEIIENDDKIMAEREINITLNDDRYELIEAGMTGNFPKFSADFTGVPDKFIEMVMDPHLNYRGYFSDGEPQSYEIYIGGEKYYLHTVVFSEWYSKAWIFMVASAALFGFILSSIIMLLICWRKNVRNKAKYRFEDFQKNITDYLITSISGPVEAIEKCTKDLTGNNVIIGEEKEQYEAIIENVKTVDKIVSEALFYNNMDRIRKKTDEEKQLEKNIPAELVKNIL
ncbi:MAG: hypothetical protein J5864_01280 [Oscillospiraceae bacterium]|nr:hypothetical protein [Oscillospiraceae bacterium]